MDTKLLELSEKLKALKDKKNDLEVEMKDVNEKIEEVSSLMIDIMTTTEMESFKHNGTTFSLSATEYPGPEPERKDELWDVMKANGYEHLFTINSKTLQANLKEMKSENDGILPEWLDGLIKENLKVSIKVTKSKKS